MDVRASWHNGGSLVTVLVTGNGDSLAALHAAEAAGTVRFVGISVHPFISILDRRKNMNTSVIRRRFLAGAGALGASAVAAACGLPGSSAGASKAAAAQGNVRWSVNVSNPDVQAFWNAMKKGFEDAHPKLSVTIEGYALAQGQTRDDLLFATMAAGTAADAWTHDVTTSYTQPFVEKSALLALDDYYRTMPNLKKLFPWARERARVRGKLYGVPQAAEFIAVYYNKGAFDRAGVKAVPATWNEFLDVNEKIKKTGIQPMAVQKERTNPGHNFSTYLMGLIGRTGYEEILFDGKRTWDKEPGVRQAAETLVTMQKQGYMLLDVLTNETADVKVDFPNGKTGLWITGMWNESTFQKAKQDNAGFDYDFFALPSQNPSIPQTLAGGLGDGAQVWAQTKNRDGIVEWIDWSIGPIGQKLRVEMRSTVPTVPYTPEDFKVPEQFRRVLRLYINAKDFGYNLSETLPSDVAQTYWNGIMAILNQKLTPNEWVQQMQRGWDVAKQQGKTPQR